MQSKANYHIYKDHITFLINGTGKTVSLKAILILTGSIFASILSLLVVIAAKSSFAAFIVILILEFSFVIFFFRAYTKGKFAPYLAILNKNEFILHERKSNTVKFVLSMNLDLLYICNIHVKIGYVYHKMSALVYGREIKSEIKPCNPSPMASILCVGSQDGIKKLKVKIIEIITS